MTAFLYVWDPGAQQWCARAVLETEEQARVEGRRLWKAGAFGVKIDVIKTVVENKR